MSKTLIYFNKDDFFNSKLYDDFLDSLKFEFSSKIDKALIDNYFGDINEAINNFYQFEPEIEKLYFDLLEGKTKSLIISFYTINDELLYALINFNKFKNKFELSYLNKRLENIDVSSFENETIDKNIANKIIKYSLNKGINALTGLNSFGDFVIEHCIYIDESKCSNELKELINLILVKKLAADGGNNIKLVSVLVDLYSLNDPSLLSVQFIYANEKYDYWFINDDLVESTNIHTFYSEISYLEIFLELASKQFIEENYDYISEESNKKNQEILVQILKNLYKKFTLTKYADNEFGYKELSNNPFIFLDGQFVKIKKSRNVDITDLVTFNIDDVYTDKNKLKQAIDSYILTKSKEYDDFVFLGNTFLNNIDNLSNSISLANKLFEKVKDIPVYDVSLAKFETFLNKIKDKYEKLLHFDKSKVSKAITLVEKIVNLDTYDKYSNDLFDTIDSFDIGELTAIKDKYDTFKEKFDEIAKYDFNQVSYRRVFIRRSVLESLKKLNLEQNDLKILTTVDEIVDKLKTVPGPELGKYLLEKGLNFPIKEDRSIKKIRILRKAKYRLLFVYGSDLDVERTNNQDSIYIFALSEHKKDKGDLYNLAKTKPNKYEINDFIIYPKNKIIKIPECTSSQYKIATFFDDNPTITFGCAGSGKTTVSIEQYVNIVYKKFNCISPSEDELVYITFHKGLSDKVKKDLAEFKINANCYKLDEYFSYVVNEKYDPLKIINESTFITWFEKTYSETELKSNKRNKKAKLTPLKDKPDIARLLYTYYRGVFKGSKEMANSSENHLSLSKFLDEMSGEEYLTTVEKNAIYEICKQFDGYASEKGLLSDNDLALNVIRKAKYGLKKTNIIIIDEVQDLTEIELLATIITLKENSHKIYFYGDPHQSIYPNVFDSSTINKVYTMLGKISSSKNAPLNITYRTNKHLISYLNELLKYRDKWIGLTKGGLSIISEPPVTSEETSWAGYVTNKSLYKRIFESNPNSMIITPSDLVKKKLLQKYPEIEEARVITIYEAKGMEWETVIIYNIFTDYECYFLDMILENGSAKKSTIHRMAFNKYYVACTRSTKSFVIIEENTKIFDVDNPIFKTLLSSFAPIYKDEQIDTYILENNTFEAWYKEALQNLNNENTSTFEHALVHAQRLAKTIEEKKLIKDLLEGDPLTLERYGFNYLNQGEYDLARSAFIKCNKATKKHSQYIVLSALLGDKKIPDEHLKEFIKHGDIIDKYPSVLIKIINQPYFKKKLNNIKKQLFDKEQ